MQFKTISTSRTDVAFAALEFLRKANEEGKLGEIENMDDVIEALDLVEHVEYLESRLQSYHIEF